MLVNMQRLLPLLLLIFCATLSAAVYKWVDESGRIHYSDQPAPGAEEIKLPEPSIYTPRSAAGIGGGVSNKSKKSGAYQSFSITSPADQATFRAGETRIRVQLSVSPRLRPGHAIRLTMNGRVLNQRLTRLRMDLGEVNRGNHRLQATIIDKKGREMIRAAPVQFSVHIGAGDASEAAASGSSDETGVDAPQYGSGGSADFSHDAGADYRNSADYTEGDDSSDFQAPTNPGYTPNNSAIPHTPGATNPAFTPSY